MRTEQEKRDGDSTYTGALGRVLGRLVPSRLQARGFLRVYGLLLALVLLAVIFEVLTGGLFISTSNIPLLLRQAAVTAIVAMGVSLIILMGEIDLSIGSAVGLCAIVAAYLMKVEQWGVPLAVLATFGVGLAIGAWQGFATTVMKVPSFVVTLAGLLAFQGVGFVITQGNTISSMPSSFQRLGQEYVSGQVVLLAFIIVGGLYGLYLVYSFLRDDQARRQRHVGRLLGLVGGGLLLAFLVLSTNMLFPIPVLVVAAAAVLLTLLARRTRFGRHLYAIGGNRTAAQLSGIPVNRNIRAMFMLMGALYALAGLLLLSRLNGAPPQGATFLELEAIAAAVIGGTSLSGGVGTVTGALLGALFTASVSNGLSIMNVSTYYQLIASGAILVIAVFLDVQSKRRAGLT